MFEPLVVKNVWIEMKLQNQEKIAALKNEAERNQVA